MLASDILLQTKLTVPPLRAHTLARDRLATLVPAGPGTRLVLLSAPAGFGKTTWLASWCRARSDQGVAVAWVTLDASDNRPDRFVAYLRAAVARIVPLPDDSDSDGDSLATATRLLNALAELDRAFLLVLDNYHLITTPAIHATVAFVLEHLPDDGCVAIASRADPPLPLARLRAHEQLVELRSAHLRFTADEMRACVQSVNGWTLSPDELRALNDYTEGWPTGVQLVAHALQSHEQQPQAQGAANATASHALMSYLDASQRHLFAYLADDVFEQQPAHIKAFLLKTAILDQMCAPLCDALLGVGEQVAAGGDEILTDSYGRLVLEQLERANLFVVPLDEQRHWYRYHPLFQAFLRSRLMVEPPETVAELHRRASRWLEHHQQVFHAVEHAIAAGESTRAVTLIADLSPHLNEHTESPTLRRWLRQLTHAEPEKLNEYERGYSGLSGVVDGQCLTSYPYQIEQLSERELEVLRLIADGASNQAIAAALVISLGTVKSHINHILGKLAARNRTEAVAHARAHGLLSQPFGL